MDVHKIQKKSKVWCDSDDENVEIDISENLKLRKLRKVDGEKSIDGKEYSERLREFHNNKVFKTKSNEWIYKARKEMFEPANQDNLSQEIVDEVKSDTKADFEASREIKTGKIYRYIQDYKITRNNRLIKNGQRLINRSKIDIKRLTNANVQSPSGCVVKSLEFHKGQHIENGNNTSLLSVSGWDKKIKLFSVDGVENKLISSLFFDNFPIYESKFTNSTEEIMFLGPRSRIGVFDLLEGKINFLPGIAGRKDKRYWNLTIQKSEGLDRSYIGLSTSNGTILVLDEQTKQLVRSFKMNESVTGLAFHPIENDQIISTSNTGEIYIWDINTGRCRERIVDYGSLCITSIVSSYRSKVQRKSVSSSYVMTGSTTGYVNIYSLGDDIQRIGEKSENQSKNSEFKIPKYIINNICTSITSMAIHPRNEIAAISTKWTKDSLKLINLYTGHVYSNWPTARTPLKYVTSMDFSEYGGYLAAGNDKGDVLLYRINEYI
ncbi:WD40 repeat-containing protein [Cryptosporidium ubiquitum]|uniref:WD40 repeat-containing protein n=1 Tax=Cryptosporidium ubiquitum TaxID=857276 RepID=A0A1J4MMS0_9CRYT|nr:WD40 repeat-containing protein [Cryptosporidium ubiquitum]OII75494.1 WD40 repeat-containing protein [Cryptosporidium ubiquitum]